MKFKRIRITGGEMWIGYAEQLTASGEQKTFSYGWSYSSNGRAFCSNRDTYCHAWAHVETSLRGVRSAPRVELFSETVRGCRTMADASKSVRPALHRARDAAKLAAAAAGEVVAK